MRKKYIIALLILFITTSFLLAIGATYAVWTTTNVQEKENVINVGCFKITFKDTGFTGAGDINLSNDYPVTDANGALKTPYKFSIKNECSIAANYAIQLETLTGSDMDTSYLKVKLNNGTPAIYKTGFTNVTSEYYGLGANAIEGKRLYSGLLTSGEEQVYELRVWIDYSAETTTPNVMGSTWLGKIVVLSEATQYVEQGVPYTGEGTSFATFLNTNNLNDFHGPAASNFVSFNGELWRVVTSSTSSGVEIIKADPIEGYSIDFAHLDDYETSPITKTVVEGGNNVTVNYYDTLSSDARSMIVTSAYAAGSLASNSVDVATANTQVNATTKNFKVFTLPVTRFILTNSDAVCNTYNFGVDLGTNKCTGTTYAIGSEYVVTATQGPNNNYIVSRAGIKELTTETNLKITPATVLSTDVFVTGGSGTINSPYTLGMPSVGE